MFFIFLYCLFVSYPASSAIILNLVADLSIDRTVSNRYLSCYVSHEIKQTPGQIKHLSYSTNSIYICVNLKLFSFVRTKLSLNNDII